MAACPFCVYFFYTGLNYTTSYPTAFLVLRILMNVVSILHTYDITLTPGPVFGLLAKAVGSPSKIIFSRSLVCAGGMLTPAILPAEPVMIALVAMFATLLRSIANDTPGIVSSQLAEERTPIPILGTAVGILSVIGLPLDSLSPTWSGKMIDDQGKRAYMETPLIPTGFAVVGVALAVVLLRHVRHKRKAEQVGSVLSEPTPVSSYKRAAKSVVVVKSAFDSEKDSDKGLAWSLHTE